MARRAAHQPSTHDRISFTVVGVVAFAFLWSMVTNTLLAALGRAESEAMKSLNRDCLIALLGLLTVVAKEYFGRRADDVPPPAGTADDPLKTEITNTPGNAVPVERVDTP